YCIRVLKGRVISSHLKDKLDFGERHDVPYGRGVGRVGKVLDELKKQGFEGNISIEYEYNWENSVPEVQQYSDFERNHGKCAAIQPVRRAERMRPQISIFGLAVGVWALLGSLAALAAPVPELAPALQRLRPGDVLQHIRTLSSDEFEGRAPATKGEELTVHYL